MRTRVTYILITLVLFLGLGCAKTNEDSPSAQTPELKVSLQVDAAGNKIKLNFILADGWHIYGPNPQKNGRPTSVIFLADGQPVTNLNWPATKIFDEGNSGPSEGYNGIVEISADLPGQSKLVNAKVTWAACSDICVPGEANLVVSAN